MTSTELQKEVLRVLRNLIREAKHERGEQDPTFATWFIATQAVGPLNRIGGIPVADVQRALVWMEGREVEQNQHVADCWKLAHERDQFETKGYFEEIYDVRMKKALGYRIVPLDPARKLGYHGAREETWTKNQSILRGHKTYFVKASPTAPLLVRTTLQRLCGRMLYSDLSN